MKVKEEAQQIFDKFNKIKHSSSNKIQKFRSKQCALICVDEIINSNPFSPTEGYFETFYDRINDCIEYWEEVKQEIEKL